MTERDDATAEKTSEGERRQAQRFDAVVPLQVDGVPAKLTDLSATGVGFLAKEPIEPGRSVEIGVNHLPDERHPQPCNAEVVRVEQTDDGFAVGARLSQPAAKP